MDALTPNDQTAAMPFTMTVTEDRMQALLSCPGEAARTPGLLDVVQAELIRRGITFPIEEPALKALAEAVVSGGDLVDLPIIVGRPPRQPQDGSLEWTADYFTSGYVVDPETKRIDFHQKTEDPAVEKGRLLVRVHPPVDGQDGLDVYGLPLKVPRPKAAFIQGGRSVTWDEKEQGFRAGCCGRVRLTGRLLEVDNVYHVKGDVGNDSGNIKHNGQLLIDGNIEPDFRVECTGNIEVRGLIYASEIICGGTLVVRKGINQSPDKPMRVIGDVVAKYIHNASIESSGNIHAETEIFQSQIKTAGEVNCTSGRIVGGVTMAGGNITVGEVGSRGNVKTLLIAGLHHEKVSRLQAHTAAITAHKEAIRVLTPVYKRTMANTAALTAAQKEAAMEMGFKISEAADEIAALQKESQTLSREIHLGRGARIHIAGLVHPGAVLRIFDAQHLVDDALLGPLAAALDTITGEVMLASETEKSMETTHES